MQRMGSKFCAEVSIGVLLHMEACYSRIREGRDYLHVYRGLENSIHPDRMEHGLRGCARIETAELLHCINVHIKFRSKKSIIERDYDTLDKSKIHSVII